MSGSTESLGDVTRAPNFRQEVLVELSTAEPSSSVQIASCKNTSKNTVAIANGYNLLRAPGTYRCRPWPTSIDLNSILEGACDFRGHMSGGQQIIKATPLSQTG